MFHSATAVGEQLLCLSQYINSYFYSHYNISYRSIIHLQVDRQWEHLHKITTDRHLQVPQVLKDNNSTFLKSRGRTTGIQIGIVLLFLLGLSLGYLSCLLLGSHYLFQVQGTIPVFPPPYFLLPEVSPLSAHAIQFLNLLF